VELLFVTVIAAMIGFIVRYTVRGRTMHGALLVPAIEVAVTAIVWVSLLWLGFTFDGGWIWALSLAAGLVAALVTAIVLPRTRRSHDEASYVRLAGVK